MLKKAQSFRRLVLVTSALLCAGGNGFGQDMKVLHGHVPKIISSLVPFQSLPSTNQLRLAIGLPLHNTETLQAFMTRLYDPASPGYRQFLTQEEFNSRFGPTAADYQAIKNFARTNGLDIAAESTNRLLLDVTGPASAVESAFHIKLYLYHHPTEARDFYAPDTEPTVDAALPVADIEGLSDLPRPKPRFMRKNAPNPRPRSGSAPDLSGDLFGNDFRNAYAPGSPLTGAGQSVALFEADGYYAADITAYARAAGNGRTNISLSTVTVDNAQAKVYSTDGNSECSLDIEMAMAIAPGLAKIIVVEGNPNNYIPNDILNGMLSSGAKNLSCSWDWSGGPTNTIDTIFTNMAAIGQSFFDASGDVCAFTAGSNSVNGVDNPSLYNGPSSSPIITQVGGTTMTMDGNGASYASETVWNWGVELGSSYDGDGSSGGVSSYYTIPAYQTSVPNLISAGGSTSYRNIPDVAANADNVIVYYGNGQTEDGVGGTSCAAPIWAGFLALVNQQAALSGRSSAGFVNPALYNIAAGANYNACFNDVTTGNNTWSGSPGLFYAQTGYDLCTGLGTPGGINLIAALSGPQALAVSPLTGFTAAGPFGGPFGVTPQNYKLTNQTASSVAWNVSNVPVWLSVSPASGSLAAHSTATITVSLAPAADALPYGQYAANLLVNDSVGAMAGLPFTLNISQNLVANGNFETDSFSGWTLDADSTVDFVTNALASVESGNYGALLGQSGSLGYLYQTLSTTPGQVYLLSLWLNNAYNTQGATPNEFVVIWNSNTLFDETNVPFTEWTNLQFVVTATSAGTMIELGFEDSPSFLGLDNISVEPVPPPVFMLRQTGANAGAFNMAWTAMPGVTYQLQYSTNLTQTNWVNLGAPALASTNSLSYSDSGALSASLSRFYRVVVAP